MGKKLFRFTAESYSKDRSGVYRLRKRMVLEQAPTADRRKIFRVTDCREYQTADEQRRQDAVRLQQAEREFSPR